ncbi:ankyrin repeat domain-containing protein [Aquimarina sp. U1-2]|uniref:ankyrin repeat domain-containing protein n=1 Tax=Aquimarina sp. U1-2 TaxID=2823141 RepID=UPI001FEE58B9|nr:ankyrin repeat domain-containing protein [Aquimarina sp. U1-2]
MKKLSMFLLTMMVSISFAKETVTSTSLNSVDYVETPRVTPFCLSIVKGDYEMVRKLIDLGTEVNQSSRGMTPLMYAARYNRVEIIKLLIDHGAKLKAKDSKGFTALEYAELSGAKDAQTLLLEFKERQVK